MSNVHFYFCDRSEIWERRLRGRKSRDLVREVGIWTWKQGSGEGSMDLETEVGQCWRTRR